MGEMKHHSVPAYPTSAREDARPPRLAAGDTWDQIERPRVDAVI